MVLIISVFLLTPLREYLVWGIEHDVLFFVLLAVLVSHVWRGSKRAELGAKSRL